MFPSTCVSILVILWLLTEGWCSHIDNNPVRSSAGNTLMSQHTGNASHSVPTQLPPHLPQLQHSQEDDAGARGTSIHLVVAERTDADDKHTLLFMNESETKTSIVQDVPCSYVHDEGGELANNTRLDMSIMGESKDNIVMAVAASHNTADDILKTSVPNMSSDPHQTQTHNHINITIENTDPSQNITLIAHTPEDEELVNRDHIFENTINDILSEKSTFVRYQKLAPSVSANSTTDVAVNRYRRTTLHGDATVHKEGSLLQSNGQIITKLESSSRKQENSTIIEDNYGGMLVRKCFGLNEFLNTNTQRPEPLKDDAVFTKMVIGLLEKNVNTDLRFVPWKIEQCPVPGDTIQSEAIDNTFHSISPFGYLRDLKSKINYDQDHYCLEMKAPGPENISSGILIKAFCPARPTEVYTRKCCGLHEYINLTDRHCYPRSSNMSDYKDLVQEFSINNPRVMSLHVNTSMLICSHGEPRRVSADQAFLDSTNQLCEHQSGQCYPSSLYCIDYSWTEGNATIAAEAFICPVDSFYKCCPRNHILTESGCIRASREDVSVYMLHLLEEMEPKFGIPARTYGRQCVQKPIKVSDSKINWWKNKPQYPPVDIQAKNSSGIRYCVDDYRDSDNHMIIVAIMCYTEAGNVRKCCHHDEYMDNKYTCVTNNLGLSLLHDPLVRAANLTMLTYNSFPTCKTKEFHIYYIGNRSTEDYGELVEGQELQLINIDRGCKLNNKTIKRENYCLEYIGNASVKHLKMMVCPRSSEDMDDYSAKLWPKAVLLGLSCIALLATTMYLFSQKVNRGCSTISKVKTLAGKLQLSYVLTSLVGFLVLAVIMVVPVNQDSPACYITSGLLTFFLLAGFQWNTSICIESLLITLNWRMSGEGEGRRYVLHSVWAWGVPGFITTLALTFSHYRASLPCSVITPRIGLYDCFFSDQKAKLVYLYVPMLLTLCANTFLLVASSCIRSANLRRMEHCGKETKTSENGHNLTISRHSGLRSHRKRNLWTESVIMVVWSGAMWFMEVIAFVVALNSVGPSHAWYSYLWYIPSSFNSLRGIGIFLIVVLTPENRGKLARAFPRLFHPMTTFSSLFRNLKPEDRTISSGVHMTSSRPIHVSKDNEGFKQSSDDTYDETLSSSLDIEAVSVTSEGEVDVLSAKLKKKQ